MESPHVSNAQALSLDFESLYPSMMIPYDYDTRNRKMALRQFVFRPPAFELKPVVTAVTTERQGRAALAAALGVAPASRRKRREYAQRR